MSGALAPTRLISAYHLISTPATCGSRSLGGTVYTGDPKGVATPGNGSPNRSCGRAWTSTGWERLPCTCVPHNSVRLEVPDAGMTLGNGSVAGCRACL